MKFVIVVPPVLAHQRRASLICTCTTIVGLHLYIAQLHCSVGTDCLIVGTRLSKPASSCKRQAYLLLLRSCGKALSISRPLVCDASKGNFNKLSVQFVHLWHGVQYHNKQILTRIGDWLALVALFAHARDDINHKFRETSAALHASGLITSCQKTSHVNFVLWLSLTLESGLLHSADARVVLTYSTKSLQRLGEHQHALSQTSSEVMRKDAGL